MALLMTEQLCRGIVAERSGGLCEARLDGCRGVGESMHHRRKRSHGGLWTPANVLHVCGDGTRGCHGVIEANPATAKGRGLWLYAGQHPLLTPASVYFRGMSGVWLLDDEGSVTWLSKRAQERVAASQ